MYVIDSVNKPVFRQFRTNYRIILRILQCDGYKNEKGICSMKQRLPFKLANIVILVLLADQALAELKLPEKFSTYAMTGAKDNVPKIYAELSK